MLYMQIGQKCQILNRLDQQNQISSPALSALIALLQSQLTMLLTAELLRDSHLTVEATEAVPAPAVWKIPVKPTAPTKLAPTAAVPKRVNGKKIAVSKEPEFKVQRPWGGYHTAV